MALSFFPKKIELYGTSYRPSSRCRPITNGFAGWQADCVPTSLGHGADAEQGCQRMVLPITDGFGDGHSDCGKAWLEEAEAKLFNQQSAHLHRDGVAVQPCGQRQSVASRVALASPSRARITRSSITVFSPTIGATRTLQYREGRLDNPPLTTAGFYTRCQYEASESLAKPGDRHSAKDLYVRNGRPYMPARITADVRTRCNEESYYLLQFGVVPPEPGVARSSASGTKG